MKRIMLLGCIAAAGAAVWFAPAAPAQARTLPGGSYLRTCYNVHEAGDRLIADCRRNGRGWARSVLSDVAGCLGDIANLNGRLICRHAPYERSVRHYEAPDGVGSSTGFEPAAPSEYDLIR